ncbi:dihydroxyacetone kinase subunit DhaL [Paenibacillus piri]|uniref:phosphoenolpyruvate--glycerone phosphotransferase n=1 Tax=Paenibacillus piri TaxID=2547395 RepID=A0A4R5KIQ0_9BACL|nr:dihydroxyacetone kinase subunit DhaL [Paenibacillus piri]TDF94160.1 dihydroxyacetone kinase subunit L [Paenibacillus piri]
MKLTFQQFSSILLQIADRIELEKDYLSELDRALGDGDHGVTMSLGWQAIADKIETFGIEDCGALLKEAAMAFLNAVGSSVGPLYATAFLRGSAVLQGKAVLSDEDVIRFWIAAVNGIQERGKAQMGDKTMMDTWIPAIEAIKRAHSERKELPVCMQEAVSAGERGMIATKEMYSRLGRSSRLGDRALGHQDPGATSAFIILSAFADGVAAVQDEQAAR